MATVRRYFDLILFLVSLLLLGAGAIGWWSGAGRWEAVCWTVSTVLGVVVSVSWVVISLRKHQLGVDLIAVLALLGALAVGEPFAGAMITVMLASGRLLEASAARRAQRDLSLLVERAPRTARRVGPGGVVEIPVDEVRRGDHLVVGPGEVVPVDGHLLEAAVLDESSLTGESRPVDRIAGETVRSGSVNAGPPIGLIATSEAASSTYAQIVRLVEQANADSAPFVRTADRFAVYFVPFTLALAGGAWLVTGDAVRAVAVLVVATPCPLLLAAPIAIMSGLSRSARLGVIIKGGEALERLAAGRVLILDKTGTVTRGEPEVSEVVTDGVEVDPDDLLRWAARLDQVSPHVMAASIVKAARTRGLALDLPVAVAEKSGYGIQGTVDGHLLRLGKASWILDREEPDWMQTARRRAASTSSLTVFVSVDGRPGGVILLEDPIRPDARRMIQSLRSAGVTRTVLLTGDRADIAQSVGALVGVDFVRADCDPAAKVQQVVAEAANGPTIMVGDGVNDAPALATAAVGVALAAGGATASSETADVVITGNRIDLLADAIMIAQRSKAIALQSVTVGMGLSLVAMVVAALGYLPPAVGALAQEGIDVLAIMVALRAVTPGRSHTLTLPPQDLALTQRLFDEHASVLPVVEQIRVVADSLATNPESLVATRKLLQRLESELLPHEHAEEHDLYPMMDELMSGPNATAALSRTHAEIDVQVARLHRLLDEIIGDAPTLADVTELRGLLYGLYAILKLHNAQEEEGLFSLLPDEQKHDPNSVATVAP
ncbi:heavy metal translocating P-type ATPase [Nakamurella sp. PAMC28650]|uniref:heavy metal translocating P-type ATPase n=1 Tax=Nakamurella sp. PAMC28650 TaxID=2762325 RepID=UPI00164E3086|nr:heavy metal translocating P-type ATPase [Nakamurella sp. PAMC28650]QNK80333.1 heavy metal translocating P-type ATPase [Nakamurella sp. PAMC28650]